MIRRRRVLAWRALALASSTAVIVTVIFRWWPVAAVLALGVWACEKAAQRENSHAWRQRLDRFGDNP